MVQMIYLYWMSKGIRISSGAVIGEGGSAVVLQTPAPQLSNHIAGGRTTVTSGHRHGEQGTLSVWEDKLDEFSQIKDPPVRNRVN